MFSRQSNTTRHVPQQNRAAQLVAAFLQAAETLFSEHGYERTTMTMVAEHVGASIGALYRYFPDKEALGLALLDVHAEAMSQSWKPLLEEIDGFDTLHFAGRFIDHFLHFMEEHPAFLQLEMAPVQLRRSAAARRASRAPLVNAIARRYRSLSRRESELAVAVLIQILRGLKELYVRARPSQKAALAKEFKAVFAGYMNSLPS